MNQQALEARDFKRILLIKLSALGDVIHTLPVLNQLRRKYPGAQIDWLAKPAIADLVRNHPTVSNVIAFPDQELRRPWKSIGPTLALGAELIHRLRAAKYDLVIDMQGQLRTAAAALITGAPIRIGFDRPRKSVIAATDRKLPTNVYRHAWVGAREGSWLAYTNRIPIETLEMHAIDRYLRVGLLLGFDDSAPDFSFPIPSAASDRADALLSQHGITPSGPNSRFVVLSPGTVWETKQWPAEKFAEVARHFTNAGMPVVLIGAGADADACSIVGSIAPATINLCGRTSLTELAAVIRRCAIAVTNDSGPMHLAVALNRPVVSIFGPTDSVWIGPYRNSESVIAAGVPCAPCYLRRLKYCTHDHRCMHLVDAATVIAKVERTMVTAAFTSADRTGASLQM